MTAQQSRSAAVLERTGARGLLERGVGEPVRRLRPLLPRQARGRGHRRHPFHHIGCKLLDGRTCRCADYKQRRRRVPDCVKLTPEAVRSISWLPPTCGYRLIAEGKDLNWWHPLVSGVARHGARGGRLGEEQGGGQRGRRAAGSAAGFHRELAEQSAAGREEGEGVTFSQRERVDARSPSRVRGSGDRRWIAESLRSSK